MTIGRRLHYRHAATLCRRPWSRYQRKPAAELKWLPSWRTYRLMTQIGWFPNGYCHKPCI